MTKMVKTKTKKTLGTATMLLERKRMTVMNFQTSLRWIPKVGPKLWRGKL